MIPHRRTILLFCGLVFAGLPARADDAVRIVTPLRPPYVADIGAGVAGGPAIRLVQRLAIASGVDPAVEIVPFERAVLTLDRGSTLYPALLRTGPREARYQWIGEVFADSAVFYSRRGTPPAHDLADAGRFATITVMRGSELVLLLRAAGLTNFRTADSETDNARMMLAGRVDAWFVPAAVGRAIWRELAFDPSLLQVSAPAERLSFWVAASPDVSPAIVARLRGAYAALRASGEYDEIVAPLHEGSPPS